MHAIALQARDLSQEPMYLADTMTVKLGLWGGPSQLSIQAAFWVTCQGSGLHFAAHLKSLSASLVRSSTAAVSIAMRLQFCATDAISVRCNPINLLVATSVSNFSLLECFALTENAVGFLRVWIGQPAIAAVSSVQ